MQNDGAESAVFQQLFQKWTLPNQTSGLGKTHTLGSVGEDRPKAGVGLRGCLHLPPGLLPRHTPSMFSPTTPGSGLPQ